MEYIDDTLYDAIEELILQDLSYIDSSIFTFNYSSLNDNLFKFLDHFFLYTRPISNDRIVLNTGTTPQSYTYNNQYSD